ncbi:MAG: sensory histidine kinase AtoS [Methanoregulaceae archaeon PtaB.Bin108]|nr:MAG: sensory histidine kinase AtoS [Methanoregulaceae archaeon PtaB.Bin108]
MIICEDDGAGVPEGIKKQIFNKYFGRNHGLGLYLIREILSIYGMTISETGKPGKGATFEIFVPRGTFRVIRG